MMKTISEAAGLSKKYTNHYLRVTAISVLSAQGVEDRDICSVSRHKNPGRLKPYCPGPDDEKRFSMSSKLHGHGKPKTALIPVASQSAASPKPSTSRGLPEIELDSGDSESAVVPAVTPTADTATHGPVANTITAISNRSYNIVQRALFAGAHFEATKLDKMIRFSFFLWKNNFKGCLTSFVMTIWQQMHPFDVFYWPVSSSLEL